ncbi:MAG: efflux transporter periplasmic adaptor subunit, partial [Beijerinckiaceae bacterium]|nr:efflux transporter periplasmic adaptor subunit [Beijerinckiaceae bacterium]
MKRIIVFVAVLVFLAALGGGLGYFQFVLKPEMIRQLILQAPPPPATVAAATAEIETWTPRIPAIGTF